MKTPIQNLYNEMVSDPLFMDLPIDFIQSVTSKFAKSIDEEKQQIIDARIDGVAKSLSIDTSIVDSNASALYYEHTYTTNKETLK